MSVTLKNKRNQKKIKKLKCHLSKLFVHKYPIGCFSLETMKWFLDNLAVQPCNDYVSPLSLKREMLVSSPSPINLKWMCLTCLCCHCVLFTLKIRVGNPSFQLKRLLAHLFFSILSKRLCCQSVIFHLKWVFCQYVIFTWNGCFVNPSFSLEKVVLSICHFH